MVWLSPVSAAAISSCSSWRHAKTVELQVKRHSRIAPWTIYSRPLRRLCQCDPCFDQRRIMVRCAQCSAFPHRPEAWPEALRAVRKQSVTIPGPRENLQVLNALNLLVVGSIPTRPTITLSQNVPGNLVHCGCVALSRDFQLRPLIPQRKSPICSGDLPGLRTSFARAP